MKTERLWPPAVLRLTWQGLHRTWPAILAAWLLLVVVNVVAFHLRGSLEPNWSYYGLYVLRTIGQVAVTAVITAWLVASLIRKMQPAALKNATSAWRSIPRGWAASFLANLLIQAPSMIGMGATIWVIGAGNFSLLSFISPVQGLVGLLASVVLGFALGEALTRGIGPVRALGASIRLTRGNRFALLLLMILLSMVLAGATSGLYALMPNTELTNGQVVQVSAVQRLIGVLSAALLTAVYLELRRIQRAGEPEGISETFD